MITAKQLHTLYINKYNKREFTHSQVQNECNIDKNTFQRLRDSEFKNIRLKDAVSIFNFLTKNKGK